ncbi:uncharacterized protein LOC125728066 [Brienomyrus brachyistius]|uniref:uncharacterized protein LOC125728066 n=1 Tax=Brienomyrus brachyistius TaxID=42636 RepID=UPI0020B43A7D|nr:uncharacterized protein LOC125728066 [Brienomyrus brachyistius]
MGSVGSRGKKVAPASVKEASGDGEQRDRGAAGGSLKPSEIQTVTDLRQSRDRAPPACHSEGRHSELSADDYDVMDADLDGVLAEYDGTIAGLGEISRQGGFWHPGRECKGGGFRSVYKLELSKETPRPCDVDRRVDFKKDFYSKHFKPALSFPDKPTCPGGLREKDRFQDRSLTKETASVPGTCEVTSFRYNRSEEDLMETIEREFS